MSVLTAPVSVQKMTAEEFVSRYAGVSGVELVRGIVKEASMPWPKHGFICSRIDRLIGNFVDEQDLGRVASNDSFVQTGGDSVLGGDVCFWSYERLPKGLVPDGLLSVAPDLVVEVKSPSDRWIDIFGKVEDYIAAGVRVVVVIDPELSTVSTYREGTKQQILEATDTLTLPDVLPGFSVPVARIFA